MRGIIKGKWLIISAWVVVVTLLLISAPNMADLVREKGALDVPDEYSSAMAGELLKEIRNEDESSVALVFHEKNKFSQDDEAEIEQAVNRLENDKKELGITEITTHFREESLKGQLVSKDETTILVSLMMQRGGREPKEVIDDLYRQLDDVQVEHYYTSGWMIDEDLIANSQEGLKKTEGITVIFILVVLLLVFRSVVTPMIPLLTVGISYLASQSIVAFLVDKWDFPISSYTQIFLVAILFGIGTDYCILLFSRFKEELSAQESIPEAIIQTYRTAGKTVFFSALAVLIGFAAIGLSTFKLYQSAVAVAVGIVVLMLALATIVPFFMAVLGRKMFWPSKGNLEHKESRFWGAAGTFALSRPLISLLLVAAVTVPFLMTYDGELSYNSLDETGDDVPSVKAFNLIADAFGPGQAMPAQIVIKNDEAMNTTEYIGLAEEISKEIEKNDQVDFVRSVTRPMGEPIEDLFVAHQAEDLGEGVGKGNDGIEEIRDGLETAGGELSNSEPQLNEARDGIGDLISGTDELKNGVGQASTALSRIEDGIRDGSMGSGEIKQGLEEVKKKLLEMSAGSEKLLDGYQEAAAGLDRIQGGYQDLESSLNELSQAFAGTDESLARLAGKYPGISEEADFQAIAGAAGAAQQGLPQMASGLAELNANLSKVQGGVATANNEFAQLPGGQKALAAGLGQMVQGVDELQKGLSAMANGQEQIIGNISKFDSGLSSINDGQQQLLDGFSGLGGQMNELTDGLDKSADGLNEVHDGLNSAEEYLSGLASSNEETSGLYIPAEVLESVEFGQSMDAYMSDNRKVMTMDVVFKGNPYSIGTIAQVDDIRGIVADSVNDTKLENAEVAVGGVTSTYNDMGNISDADYTRTVILMLSGIALILFFLLRSIIMPLYLIASLILTYYTSSAITEVIFVNILGYSGISWAVPFFAFVILIALGIDYSIFLMDRFNEYKDKPVKEAMLLSMRKMGTVIISAAVILGGTFAAMMPAGVLSLLQIATLVLIGLALYALVILPLFIPVMAKIFGKANWWPFIK